MRESPVVVVGAGYVGLTLGLFMASRRVPVLVVDIDEQKVERLQRGDSTMYEANLQEALTTALASGFLNFSTHAPARGARHWFIAVPYIPSELSEQDTAARYLESLKLIRGDGSAAPVIMIRSTVPIGFTRSKIIPRLTQLFSKPVDAGFFLSVCPERTLTGVAIQELAAMPQLIGGSPASVAETLPLFERCGVSPIVLEQYEAAELGKSICNLSRLSQFNLANFFGLCCEAFGINAPALLKALSLHYPRLQLSVPGPGIGGSCLPKDSLVLTDGLNAALDADPTVASTAREVWTFPRQQFLMNEHVIAYTAQAAVDFVTADASSTIGSPAGADSPSPRAARSPVLALGIAFKGVPRTDDTRNSVGLKIVEALKRSGIDVRVFDVSVHAPAVQKLGFTPASLPIDPIAYSSILLLNNDPGYLEVLQSGLSPDAAGTVNLFDPWRLLADTSTVFARAVPFARLAQQLRPGAQPAYTT